MKKALIIVVIALVAICGIGGWSVSSKAKQEAEKAKTKGIKTVSRGDLVIKVIETGTLDAAKVVEVKSRVAGRIAKLLVEEGDSVIAGQLIAVIDPQETELRVRQDRAQLRGAQSGVERQRLEIEQRKVTAAADLRSAQARVEQLKAELRAQPILTNAAINQAQSSLNTATQERERLLQSSQPMARVSAESSKREAEANYENAKRELERQRELMNRGFTSQRSVESAQLQVDLARARLESASENQRRLESQLSSERSKAEDQVQQAKADLARAKANSMADSIKARELESAQANLQKARIALRDVQVMAAGMRQSQSSVEQLTAGLDDAMRQLKETEIRAPITGVVAKKLIQEGELVASLSSFSSGTPIVRIEDRRAMIVKLDVNEIDVAKLRMALPAEIEVDAIPNVAFAGKVTKIAPAANAAAQGQADAVVRYQVEIQVASGDPRLRSGMSAKCTLESLRKNNVLQLPLEYVGQDGKQRFVQVPAPKGKEPDAKRDRKNITVGVQTSTAVEILGGVKEGENLVKPEYKGPERKGMMSFGPDEEV